MAEAVYLQLLEGPLETDLGSFPGVVPLNSSQISLTPEAQVPEIVAVPPKLGLIPARSLPELACNIVNYLFSLGRKQRAAYLDVLDDNAARDGVLAVTARTVELAEVGNLETIDGDDSLTVVLNNLVRGRLGASTLDHGVAITLQGKSILANIDPPDVLNGARSLAVNTLNLVYCYQYIFYPALETSWLTFADNGVLEGTAVLDDEDGVRVATLSLTSAADTTAVGLHATIEGARDGLSLLVGDRALGAGDRNGGALLHGEGISRGGDGRAGGDRGREGSNSGDDSELHVDG